MDLALLSEADIWHFRWNWKKTGESLFRSVVNGKYRLSPLMVTKCREGSIAIWSASDALVLKWVSLQVKDQLPQPEACMHLKGRCVWRSISEISDALGRGEYSFIHLTDIKGYYEHIKKPQVISLVECFVKDNVLRGLIHQYVYYSVE